ncbi:MAG: CvpA family protein, partial [Isosphaeraceae bacterium]|nr:CvpA family protein [Isosphaeraceae bacterium]
MVLDLILAALILIGGLRGFFRGFLLQAISLAALIGCVYLADPVRDYARPYVQPHLPALQPELVDKLLWWASAVAAFVVTGGLATLAVKMTRRRPFGVEPEPNRTDQGAGFLLGAAKGLLVVTFLTAGLARYAPTYFRDNATLQDQIRKSRAIAWDAKYHPAEQIWNSAPVQTLVARIKSRGLWSDAEAPAPTAPEAASPPPVQTAARP